MGTRKPVKKPKASTHRSYYYRLSKRYRGDNEAIYNTLSDNLSVEDKKKGPYKKAIGYQKNGDPCHFEITKKNYIIIVYDFKKNWRSWLKDQLTKHGLSKADAIKITKNLVRDISESHLVLGDIIVPPHLVGQKVRDKISGITIKFGDESHPDNLEIEVDHEVKQKLEAMKEETHDISKNIKELLKLHLPKPRKGVFNRLEITILTPREYRELYKKVDKIFPEAVKSHIDHGNLKVFKLDKESKQPLVDGKYIVSGNFLKLFFENNLHLLKLDELVYEGKLMRVKQP
jgi:hypothetical protein